MIISSSWPVAGSPRKNRPGAVVVSSPRSTPAARGTVRQTAATSAKRHTREPVQQPRAGAGDHKREMEAAQQQRGAADGANGNRGDNVRQSNNWNTSSEQGRGVSTRRA